MRQARRPLPCRARIAVVGLPGCRFGCNECRVSYGPPATAASPRTPRLRWRGTATCCRRPRRCNRPAAAPPARSTASKRKTSVPSCVVTRAAFHFRPAARMTAAGRSVVVLPPSTLTKRHSALREAQVVDAGHQRSPTSTRRSKLPCFSPVSESTTAALTCTLGAGDLDLQHPRLDRGGLAGADLDALPARRSELHLVDARGKSRSPGASC